MNSMKPSIGRPWVIAAVLASAVVSVAVRYEMAPSGVKLVSNASSASPVTSSTSESAPDNSVEDGDSVPSSADDQAADLAYAAKIGKYDIDQAGTMVNYIPLRDLCENEFKNLSDGGTPLSGPMPEYTREAFITACMSELRQLGYTGTDPNPFDDGRPAVYGDPNDARTWADGKSGGSLPADLVPHPQAHGSAIPDRAAQDEPAAANGSATLERNGQQEPAQANGSAALERGGQEEPGDAQGSATMDRSGQEEPADGGTPDVEQPSDDQGESDPGSVVG